MLPSEIEALGLKFGDEVELSGIIVTYSAVSGGVYKLFAQSIAKKNAPAPKPDQGKAKEWGFGTTEGGEYENTINILEG